MNQEIKQKLEQAAKAKAPKHSHDPLLHIEHVEAFKAGAQTILENPGEWGLVKPSTFESLRHDYNTLSKAIDGVVSNRIEEWKANNDVLKDVSALQSQLAKYREALERIADPIAYMESELKEGESLNGAYAIRIASDGRYLSEIAKEALKKQ